MMICDDEPDLLNLFGRALKPKYNVILVGSGKEYIKRFIEENSLQLNSLIKLVADIINQIETVSWND